MISLTGILKRIFNFLSERVCFTFAVSVFSVTGAIASVPAMIFVRLTVDYKSPHDLKSDIILCILMIGTAALVHYLFYGLGRLWGKRWELKGLRVLNDHIKGLSIPRSIPTGILRSISYQLDRLPALNTRLATILSTPVVIIGVLQEVLVSGNWINGLSILRGAIIAWITYIMFTFLITEIITNDVRRDARRLLATRDAWKGADYSSTLTRKFGFILMLMFISIAITHGISASKTIASPLAAIVILTILILAVGVFMCILVFLSIINPLREIKETASNFIKEQSAQLITGSINQEFIDVAQGLYSGAQMIVEYRDQLHALNMTLEKRVQERTAEIKSVNENLQSEISEHKKTEETLKESEEKYRTIIENIEDGYLEVDLRGNITFSNDSLCRMTGYTRDEFLGMNYKEYTSEETARKLYQTFNEVYRTGKPARMVNYKVIRKDGSIGIHEQTVSPINDSGGQPIGFRSVARDVTERKKMEAQLQQAQRLEAIGTLAGGIAHDFNNLLMGIQGNASLMLMDCDSIHPHYKRLKTIEQSVQSGAELTMQLLGFARGGKYEVRPADINDLIKRSSDMFARTKKEIKVLSKYQESIWTVEADQSQIEQVLLNLYVNAWQAMPGGGKLYLETENVTLDEDYVKTYNVAPGRYVKVSVTDTGVGMDEATRQKIFEPFFTTKEMGRGTGLGLASAYGIIKNHDGIINVYSEEGVGTTFNIYLPASDKAVIGEKVKDKEVLRGKETVLLVDDEEMIIDIGKEMLEYMGYKVLTAKGGKKAIDVYKKNQDKIDAVILDMIMPEMGGGEIYDHMKGINPDIKAILSSGYSMNGKAEAILARGCNGFIQKPFNMNELSQKIRDVLDKK